MPLHTSIVGAPAGERVVTITTRHCTAYAAGTDDLNERYFDDARAGGVVAPPMFGVSLDWALRGVLTSATGLSAEESLRGVHATHDMLFHRPIRPGDELAVRGTVVQAEGRPPGTYLVTRYDTTDAAGSPVLTVYYGSLFRGVDTHGEARTIDAAPQLVERVRSTHPRWEAAVAVARQAPHVYSECADIYNPIHTERTVALAAGLPDIIVHGTLTLAYAARELLDREAGGEPERLQRIACRFGGMVVPGSTIRVRLDGEAGTPDGRVLFFSVAAADGAPAVRDGVALLRR